MDHTAREFRLMIVAGAVGTHHACLDCLTVQLLEALEGLATDEGMVAARFGGSVVTSREADLVLFHYVMASIRLPPVAVYHFLPWLRETGHFYPSDDPLDLEGKGMVFAGRAQFIVERLLLYVRQLPEGLKRLVVDELLRNGRLECGRCGGASWVGSPPARGWMLCRMQEEQEAARPGLQMIAPGKQVR